MAEIEQGKYIFFSPPTPSTQKILDHLDTSPYYPAIKDYLILDR